MYFGKALSTIVIFTANAMLLAFEISFMRMMSMQLEIAVSVKMEPILYLYKCGQGLNTAQRQCFNLDVRLQRVRIEWSIG